MVTLCPNCSAPIVFDPKTQRVVCHTCGSSFDPQKMDLSKEDVDLAQTDPGPIDEIEDKEVAAHFLDCYVYHCPSCGGEIIVNGTESSTRCIYCGNPSVVFNRISKQKAPDYIIPFSITREQALEKLKETLRGRYLIPKAIRELRPDMMRGIYVPYWIVNGRHVEAAVIRSYMYHLKSGSYTSSDENKYYYGRSGKMQIRNLPLDASEILSDDSSQRLEPYDLSAIVPFNESYLLGFYSNASDITYTELIDAAEIRAVGAFHERAKDDISGMERQVVCWEYETAIDKDIKYALLPVWFVSYEFDGEHNVIMVNGQTGKVVGGIPWRKKLVTRATWILTAIFTFILASGVSWLLLAWKNSKGGLDPEAVMGLIAMLLMLGGLMIHLANGKRKLMNIHLKLSQASSIFHFTKKRQG